MAVEVGKSAPSFTLKNQNDKKVSLSDFKGKNVILYFYPKDMTPGCTTQACDFRDAHSSFQNLNSVIVGVSPDSIDQHRKFIGKYDLPFYLLADEEHKVAELYDVWKLKKNFGREYYGIERSTFIINETGHISKIFRNVRVKNHVEKALNYLKQQVSEHE